MRRCKTVVLWMLFFIAILGGAHASRAAETAWARSAKIAAFDGRFGYEAYADRVVVIDNASGKREAIRAGGRSASGASFAEFLAGNAEVAGKLGAALSPETKALGGKLRVQVFRNGALLYEPASRTRWWSWHSQARPVAAGSTPASPATPKPGVFSAVIIDELGAASPAERQMIASALRDFKVRHGITIGVVFLKPMSLEAAQEKAKSYRQQLLEKNYLPASSAVFTLRDDASYIWQSDDRVRGQISFDQVRQAWNKTSNSSNRAQLTREFLSELSQMLGEKAPVKTPVQPPVNTTPVNTAPVPTTPVSNAPASTLGGSTPPAVQPGEIIAQKRIGPAGGAVAAPGVAVEFPPGALKVEERIVLRRTRAAGRDTGFVFVERDGGSTLLARPAKVRFTLPSHVPADDVLATQQLSDEMWMIEPSTYDAKTRTLEMDVLHFSGAGWFNKKTCVSVVGGAVTAIGTGIVWIAAAGVGVVAAVPTAIGLGTVAIIATGGAVGAALSNPAYDHYQRMGLDGVLTLSARPDTTDFVIRWKSSDYAADKSVLTVALDKQGKLVAAVPAKADKNQFFEAMAKDKRKQQIDSFQIVPRSIFALARALVQTKMYYRTNKYDPPGAVEVLVDSNLSKSKERETHLGEWDEKFLRVHSKLVKSLLTGSGEMDAKKNEELLATLMHEYWHVIYFARGYGRTNKYSWLDESMATALESEGGGDYRQSFHMYQAATIAPQFERGLTAFTDPYCAWPLGKYFLHKQDGNYVSMIGKGMKGTADWSGANGLFADFVRSLLITEYALPDPDNGVPTGWNDLDVARWSAARGVRGGLKLGDNGAVASPAMSYSLRIANVPLRAGETATPLIVRRQKPDATELFIALKPATGTTIGTSRAKNAVSQGPGGVALPASWMTQPTSLVPVGMANITTGAGNASPLYVYRLQPPKEITSTPAGGGVTLRWKKPDLGEKLRAEDALHGYRVFYENKDGKTVMVPDFLIKPETQAVTILASAMPGFTTVGLASEDQFVRDANGKPLLSPIAWPETQSGIVTVIVHEPKPDNVDMSYGFENVLGGKPIPKAPVTCDYVDKGKPVHLEAETDAKGVCRFSKIPLNVEVTIGAQGAKKKALCTADKPRPSVTFGWMGHEIKPEDMPRVEGERTQSKPSN